MHPVLLGQAAQDHIASLIHEADSVRLARTAAGASSPGLRRRLGLGLIAVGSKLSCEGAPTLTA